MARRVTPQSVGQSSRMPEKIIRTYMLGPHNMRELNPLLIAELHCAIIGNRHFVNVHQHIILLQHIMSRRQWINLVHQAARLVWRHLQT